MVPTTETWAPAQVTEPYWRRVGRVRSSPTRVGTPSPQGSTRAPSIPEDAGHEAPGWAGGGCTDLRIDFDFCLFCVFFSF